MPGRFGVREKACILGPSGETMAGMRCESAADQWQRDGEKK